MSDIPSGDRNIAKLFLQSSKQGFITTHPLQKEKKDKERGEEGSQSRKLIRVV